MKSYFILSLFIGATLLSACSKKFTCDCKGVQGSVIFYKAGTETNAKDSCEKAGCTFTERD